MSIKFKSLTLCLAITAVGVIHSATPFTREIRLETSDQTTSAVLRMRPYAHLRPLSPESIRITDDGDGHPSVSLTTVNFSPTEQLSVKCEAIGYLGYDKKAGIYTSFSLLVGDSLKNFLSTRTQELCFTINYDGSITLGKGVQIFKAIVNKKPALVLAYPKKRSKASVSTCPFKKV